MKLHGRSSARTGGHHHNRPTWAFIVAAALLSLLTLRILGQGAALLTLRITNVADSMLLDATPDVISACSVSLSPAHGAFNDHRPPKRIAIYEDNNHHTETMGFLLDYASRRSINVTLYVDDHTSHRSWVPLYRKVYPGFAHRNSWHWPDEWEEYDVTFFVTAIPWRAVVGADIFPARVRAVQLTRPDRCVYIVHHIDGWRDGLRTNQSRIISLAPMISKPFLTPTFRGADAYFGGERLPFSARNRALCLIGSGAEDSISKGRYNDSDIRDYFRVQAHRANATIASLVKLLPALADAAVAASGGGGVADGNSPAAASPISPSVSLEAAAAATRAAGDVVFFAPAALSGDPHTWYSAEMDKGALASAPESAAESAAGTRILSVASTAPSVASAPVIHAAGGTTAPSSQSSSSAAFLLRAGSVWDLRTLRWQWADVFLSRARDLLQRSGEHPSPAAAATDINLRHLGVNIDDKHTPTLFYRRHVYRDTGITPSLYMNFARRRNVLPGLIQSMYAPIAAATSANNVTPTAAASTTTIVLPSSASAAVSSFLALPSVLNEARPGLEDTATTSSAPTTAAATTLQLLNYDTLSAVSSLRRCAFILIHPRAGQREMVSRMTGALPTALIARTPLLAPRAFTGLYGDALTSASVTFNFSLSEVAGYLDALNDTEYDRILDRLDAVRAAAEAASDALLDRLLAHANWEGVDELGSGWRLDVPCWGGPCLRARMAAARRAAGMSALTSPQWHAHDRSYESREEEAGAAAAAAAAATKVAA